jgi:glycosyltransferase involved in cell wall biosynthesis
VTSLRVCALVPYPLGSVPSQRYRLEQWASDLLDEGIRLDLVPFADDHLMRLLHRAGRTGAKVALGLMAVLRRMRTLARIGRYDVVVVHRAAALAGPAWIEKAVALRRPLVFDFDDAVWLLHTTAANRRFGWLKAPGKTASLCRMSTHVVAGNAQLAEYARAYNDKVSVVPSSVDTDAYRPAERQRPHSVVVGWMGSSTSQTHLEQFAPMLRQIAEIRGVELRICSDREPDLADVQYLWRRWSRDKEIRELQEFDIGIMPMPDDAWARGKGAMKALLYMAVGIPVVCSPVGTNLDVVQHEQNGLFATTSEEWRSAIQRLLQDAELRSRLGMAGRATVESSYSRRRSAAAFANVLREAARTSR